MGREGTNQWSQITGLMQEWRLGDQVRARRARRIAMTPSLVIRSAQKWRRRLWLNP